MKKQKLRTENQKLKREIEFLKSEIAWQEKRHCQERQALWELAESWRLRYEEILHHIEERMAVAPIKLIISKGDYDAVNELSTSSRPYRET